MRHVLRLAAEKRRATSGYRGLADSFSLGERINRINPILEAFGNARTGLNDNSSRFGKFLELRFDQVGSILGARMSQYLLEKARVVHRSENEDNFYILHYIVNGMTAELQSQHKVDPAVAYE